MSALFFDGCWLVGGILGALVLHKGFHAGWFTVKHQKAVRVSPELLDQMRSEVVFNASKRVVRADFNRSFK